MQGMNKSQEIFINENQINERKGLLTIFHILHCFWDITKLLLLEK